jgi:DHA2 family multidrug resistance protein
VLAAMALVTLAIWEWFQPTPVVDVRLLKTRNFAVTFLMMGLLGAALYGTTVLLPLFLQTVLGYSATQAGEVLSPGGVIVIVLLPLVGRLMSRVQARWLVLVGFASLSWSLFHMSGLYPGISFSTAVMYRIYQSIGLAFLFVPITTSAYVGIAPEKNNQVSALTNVARNIGGSIGISAATTILARRAQYHQDRLVHNLSAIDPSFRDTAARLARFLAHSGIAAADATRAAWGRLYGELVRQSTVLAYADTMHVFAILSAVMIPFVFLLRKSRPGAAMAH